MKDINRFLQSLILAACCFAFVACSDENTPTTNTLEIEASNTFFNVEGGTKKYFLQILQLKPMHKTAGCMFKPTERKWF